jgi:transcriptional regulator with XRE-family HTH domain
MSLAENVKKRRKEKKLTQEQLAEQAGVSIVYITQMETNVRNLNIQVVYLVAKALGCTLNDLYDEDEKNAV